jgi:hypothetical protein
MDYDQDKVDEVALALMYLTLHEDFGAARAWKGYDWDILDRLHAKGWIHDPKSKAKSVAFTEEGLAKAEEFFKKYFG